MDLGTGLGLILGVLLVGGAIAGGGVGLGPYLNLPSVLIVIGGTVCATMVSLPIKNLKAIVKVVRNAFFEKAQPAQQLIRDLVRYAEVARRDGILSLENMTDEIEDHFIVKGIQMAVDGTDPELIEQIMQLELSALEERHAKGQAIFRAMGTYAPAFGMIGTLIGLVAMLQQLDDPKTIGPAMAVALLTTFYGAFLANLVFLPLAEKLSNRTDEERLVKEIIIRGVMSIQSGDNPRIVEQKLKSFLPPSLREEPASS